jgi:hypothetical protein
MNNELERIWKGGSWRNLRYYPGICLEGLRKTTKTSVTIAVSGPGFDLRTSRTRGGSANHLATTLVDLRKICNFS